jgi:16S rRNA (guanine966-N2)-methyltransferase
MRIISGEYKGRQLKTPVWEGTRPMTDKVRGAVFEILGDEVSDARVLDCFAGTGAIGIEALSRGAQKIDFVDFSFKCAGLIRQNLGLVGALEKGTVHCEDAEKFLHRTALKVEAGESKLFDLIFYTPPYRDFRWDFLPKFVPLMSESATLVAEKDRFLREPPLTYANLVVWDQKLYGDTEVIFLVKVA